MCWRQHSTWTVGIALNTLLGCEMVMVMVNGNGNGNGHGHGGNNDDDNFTWTRGCTLQAVLAEMGE